MVANNGGSQVPTITQSLINFYDKTKESRNQFSKSLWQKITLLLEDQLATR